MAAATIPKLVADLQARGLIQAVTSPSLYQRLHKPITLYTGIDPTANAMHIGNLMPMMSALRFMLHGHSVLALVGGATGAIGDPSGRATERSALSRDVLEHNNAGITRAVTSFFDRGREFAHTRGLQPTGAATANGKLSIVNNREWTEQMSLIDFLGNVGRHARVSTMLHRDSVKSRMETDSGISFTEFTYQLIQANDFYHLHATRGCELQIGGSDQWGNIVAGLDLIRRKSGGSTDETDDPTTTAAFGLTLPLVTTSTGEKFGKSAGNAVWMDPKRTSVFDFYQFFFRAADAEVAKYLKYFTLVPVEEISELMVRHESAPEARVAQRRLADEMTELVHSPMDVKRAQVQTALLFADSRSSLATAIKEPAAVIEAFQGDPRLVRVAWKDGMTMAELFASVGATASKSEAVKLAKRGGLYLNQERVVDALTQKVTPADLLGGQICLLRTGKANYKIAQVIRGL
ncbi:hypothetical protein BC828DRAFT_383222 [Blastocladiella britannica]|nr:hypothetical protein BC828DRAFT_383222 [Blastocladiella britannica]